MVWALAQSPLQPAPGSTKDFIRSSPPVNALKKWNRGLPTPSPMGNPQTTLPRSEIPHFRDSSTLKGLKRPSCVQKLLSWVTFPVSWRAWWPTSSCKMVFVLRRVSLVLVRGCQSETPNWLLRKERQPPKVNALVRGSGRWAPFHGESWQSHSNMSEATTQEQRLSEAHLVVHACQMGGKQISAFVVFTMYLQGCSRETIEEGKKRLHLLLD